MKYFVRAVKYLIYFAVLFLVIVALLCVLLKHPLSSFTTLFKDVPELQEHENGKE